jgi:phage terminase large subunit
MRLSNTFIKTMRAYKAGYRFIINRGSSRSSKTYSTLQLFEIISKRSKKKRIIHVVSVSIPHLRDGAITDFDQILENEGHNLDEIKIKSPYTYIIGNTTIRFIGADKIGAVKGAQRDILFINEANHMKWDIVHQLIQRTTEAVFIDFNPSEVFWVDTEGISERENAIVLHSTFLDNIDNLTDSQITEFQEGKKKHDEEEAKDIKGHWYNWWRVFGCGLPGVVEGAIFNNWSVGKFDDSLDYLYGMDFGWTDPFVLIKVAFDSKAKKIYLQELIYRSKVKIDLRLELMEALIPNKDNLILADCADPTKINELADEDYNIIGLSKDKVSVGIKRLQDWEFVITEDSYNFIHELQNYVWADKTGEVAIDKLNHCCDSLRYVEKYYTLKMC